MWRGRHVQQGRCHDCDEEDEHNAKRNLRRLIHTVQRLPSNRSPLDTTSLWNLVGELETFSPPLPTRTAQSTHTVKNHFNKKNQPVRLNPPGLSSAESHNARLDRTGLSSTDSQSHRSKTFSRDSQHEHVVSKPKNSALNNKLKPIEKIKPQKQKFEPNKNRNKTLPEKPIERKKESLPSVSRSVKSKAPIKSIPTKTTANVSKANTERDNAYTRRNTNIKETNITSKIKHDFDKSQTKTKTKGDKGQHNGLTSNIRNEFRIIEKVIELKEAEFKLDSKRSTQLVVSTGNHSINDQSSVVKQLTIYWNNLLNTDTDGNNVDTVNSVFRCCSNKSLKEPTEITSIGGFQNGLRISNIENMQRHLSESNINILKRIESLSSGMSCSSTSINLENNVVLEEHLPTMPRDNIMSPLTETEFTAPTTANEVFNRSSSNNSVILTSNRFDVTTDNTVKVLKNILNQLVLFPKRSILSDEIGLSQPVKTMLCLMTATLLTSSPETDDLEGSILPQDCKKDNGKELELLRPQSRNNLWEDTGNHFCYFTSDLLSSTLQCTTVAIPKITLSQAEYALSIFMLCKDFVWMRSILGENFRDKNGDYFNCPSRSYTFIYEGHLVLEEDYSDSDQEEQDYDSEIECNNNCSRTFETSSRLINYILKAAEDIAYGATECIKPYLPNSVEGFVKMMYQVLVSILIWQVIAKDFMSK